MKASSKEHVKKKYSLASNTFETDTTCVDIHELPTSRTQQKYALRKRHFPNKISNEKSLKTSSFYNHAQPCPFTFLTAVKCKFPVDKSHAACNQISKPDKIKKVCEYSMDPVEPLNVPNLQISPKICPVSEKIESSNEKSKKLNSSYKTKLDSTNDKLTYSECTSSTDTTTLKSRNLESLKASNIVPSKDRIAFKNNTRERDNSRDKENRFKKIRKEDSSVKSRNDIQSIVKCSKNQKHISRKDILDKVTNKLIKNDNILNRGFKENDNTIRKSAKKNREKSHKSSSFSTRLHKELSADSSASSTGKFIVDNNHQNIKVNVDNCQDKHDSQVSNTLGPNANPTFLKHQNNSNSAESRDISQDHLEHLSTQKSTKLSKDSAMASVEKYQKQGFSSPSLVLSTTKEEMFNNLHIQENNVQHVYSTVLDANDSNKSSNSIIETKLDEDSLSEKLMDPLRISFRDDSYSNQPEFTNLVTPNVNLTIRSKRRKQVLKSIDSNDNHKDSKLSRKDQNIEHGVEVQAKTESNSSDQSVSAQKPTHFIEDHTQDKVSSISTWEKMSDIKTESICMNTGNNEKEIKNWPTLKIMDKPTYLQDNIQTETISCQYGSDASLVFPKDYAKSKGTFHISLNPGGEYEDASRMDDISLSKKMRTMSEISLHETTSSIRTESGTEISISLRDVTCSFNKNLDLEMAQLIDDERQRYNKIEMLFKSQEKSLIDRTRKLVKLEEEKKVLRDSGQDSRISSVKKKQRALLLKLQQEKDEMNRLKELHKIASQERKLMLQKQRDMFNPDMSTKNILHKLKRSADSQSPRRLSGPMKGYDIRSNSSISSLIDSDKSQLDRSKFDCTMNISDVVLQKENESNVKLGIETLPNKTSRSAESHDTNFSKIETGKYFEEATMSQVKCDLRSKKFDERMPKSDTKYQLYDFESVLENGAIEFLKDDKHVGLSRSKDQNFIYENVRTKSNALIDEFTEIWKSHFSQSKNEASAVDVPLDAEKTQYVATLEKLDGALSGKLQSNSNIDDDKSTKRKGLKWNKSKTLPINSSNTSDLRYIKNTICHKSKSSEAIDKKDFGKNNDSTELDELLSNTKQISVQELIKHSDLLKERNEELLKDIVDERNNFAKQSSGILLSSGDQERKKVQEDEIIEKSDNVSVQSHVSLAISHQSSNESDASYLKSVVIRSQQDYQPNSSFQTTKKLEQILKAREATLISRRNCVEEWISWHARLRDEEERVSRMEKAAYKLVSATARTLSLNDTTISSDNSDVEGRIELLTKKLSDRRFEMTRLKKEARKQAKRRLRALEANLMTQIKRYDATINEMQKKLETKKEPNKESTKLEIESKSVNDYKVPDIPIKNIQEIYKRSGLLCSQSNSDIAPIYKNNNDMRDESNDIQPTSSRDENGERITKSISMLGDECKSITTCTDNSYKSQSHPEIQKSEILKINSKDNNLSRSSNVSGQSSSKISSIELEKNTNSSVNTENNLTHDSKDGSPLILSSQLSHIQLHNKELNDDIHNLENDLRELSEMMLNFSKKSSDPNSISMDSTRKTSKAMDEPCSTDKLQRLDKSKLDIESDTADTYFQTRVKETLSNGIPDTDNISTSIEELYSEIKSKDDRVEQHSHVPESSGKSIETDVLHQVSKSLQAIDEKDYKTDTCSIMEIISTTVEKDDEESMVTELDHQEGTSKLLSKDSNNRLKIEDDDDIILSQSLDTTLQNKSELDDNNRESSIETRSRDDIHRVGSKDECQSIQLTGKSQNVSYPIENKNELLASASENAVDSDNVMTELNSFHDTLDKNERKFIEWQAQDADCNRNSINDMEDSTIFVPKGESTNLLETFVLKLDNSSDIGMGIDSEELNDIHEIIERETKNDDRQENGFQEIHFSAQSKEGDIYPPVEHNNALYERSFDEENTTSQEFKKSSIESETIFENTNNDSNSLGLNVINANDQCGQTVMESKSFIKLDEAFEHAKVDQNEDDSSDGEQTNNLIEVVENKPDTLQKSAVPRENKIWTDKHKTHVTVFLDRTLQVVRDPEYEDISEESLEVSDIFNNTNPGFHKNSKKLTTVPEKYIIKSESNEVLRILDEISSKSNKFDHQEVAHDDLKDPPIDTNTSAERSSENVPFNEPNRSQQDEPHEKVNREILGDLRSKVPLINSSVVRDDAKQMLHMNSENFTSLNDDKHNLHLDIKKDPYLDIDAFSDNPVNNNALLLDEEAKDTAAEFRTTPMGVSSEKDIETMIKKLKASLDQPGIEVAELEARLLEIENLQIELEIKKLEAEEVSYYVREIPNKPPPPYTPPGSVRQSGSSGVSCISIIPTNIEELTFVTEKATAIIHVKKKAGQDVQFLEAPDEIYENVKDSSSNAVEKNRLIYNTFLFDLCKELIVDIYKVEEENPGPSWTKPKVKTKRVIKIPKCVNELNEYVSKEVATLFGFKTKLQRENMVMRWSRKRRDRVDELLAKEAQAEEKEWTKFHHDELAVKNELTVTILNNLLMETTSCIKNAYTKKRKLSIL